MKSRILLPVHEMTLNEVNMLCESLYAEYDNETDSIVLAEIKLK